MHFNKNCSCVLYHVLNQWIGGICSNIFKTLRKDQLEQKRFEIWDKLQLLSANNIFQANVDKCMISFSQKSIFFVLEIYSLSNIYHKITIIICLNLFSLFLSFSESVYKQFKFRHDFYSLLFVRIPKIGKSITSCYYLHNTICLMVE